VLAARGITIDNAQRYTLLRETASALAFLHKHGVCVGDISPKNLLFSLDPHEAVYFIDCDAMRINGVSVLPQVETPGWNAPTGEELATIYSDTYKLGLLALRLLTGEQDTTNLQHIPTNTPTQLRQIITDTLTRPAHQRPLPEAWTYVLANAIEQAQCQPKTTTPVVAAPAAPPIPVVRSRPPAHSAPPIRPSAPPPASAPPASRPTPSAPVQRPVSFVAPGVLVMIFAVAFPIWRFTWLPPSTASEVIGASTWLFLAVAFGLVARRCRAKRAVAITAWLTCAAAVVGMMLAPVAVILLGAGNYNHNYYLYFRVAILVAFLALIAFGVAARRPFGWWWSVPASVAGYLGALGVCVPLGLLCTLIPLIILGIAMCRTRIGSSVATPTPN